MISDLKGGVAVATFLEGVSLSYCLMMLARERPPPPKDDVKPKGGTK